MKGYYAMESRDKSWFCARLNYHGTSDLKGIKQVEENGNITAMVAFDEWTKNSAQMHVWISNPRAMNRTLITECLHYLFVTCDRGIAIGVTPCNNVRSLEFNKKLGFVRLLTIKDGYALGTDLAIQELRRENCRWLQMRVPSGQEQRASSA